MFKVNQRTRNFKPGTRIINLEPDIRNLESEIRNLEPDIRNLEPDIRNQRGNLKNLSRLLNPPKPDLN